MPHAEVALPAVPRSVSQARRFADSALYDFGLDDLSWEVLLLVSELVTNCVLHAGTEITLRLEAAGEDEVRIEVSDRSARMPVQRVFSDRATTGRGMDLLAKLAASWGVEPDGEGKTVWAVVRRSAESGLRGDADLEIADLLAVLPQLQDDGLDDATTLRAA